MAPGVYRVEVSPNNRAGCTNTECKTQGIKIPKGEIRFGNLVTIQEHQSWKWKHWGCVTPRQIAGVKEAIEDDVDLLDGYEDLPESLQDKVKSALAEGHVADDEWTGDVEMNRPGKNGYRTPANKKRQREEAKAQNEAQVEAEDESASPSKPTPTKKDRIRDEAHSGGDKDEEPAPKKRKVAPKKPKKTAEGETDDAAETEPMPAKKARKIAQKPKAEARPAVGLKDASNDQDVLTPPPAKRGRKNAKMPKTEAAIPSDIKDEANDDDPASPAPAKKTRAPRKSAATKKLKDEEVAGDAMADAAPAKKRAPRRTAAAKKVGAEQTNADEMEDTTEGAAEVANAAEDSIQVKADQDANNNPDGEDGPDELVSQNEKSGNKGGKKAANGMAAGPTIKAKAEPKQQAVASTESKKPRKANTRAKRAPA